MEECAKEETIGIRNVGEKTGFIHVQHTKSSSSIQLKTYHVYPGGHVSQADSSFFLSVLSGLPNLPKGQLESHDVWPGTD